MKIPVTNNLKVAYVEIIDSDYNEAATIGNKDVYAYDQNDNLLCVSKLKNYFSPRQLHKIADSLKRGGQGRSLKMNKQKQKIKQKIDNLWPCKIYRQTIEEANKYTFGGRVITYIDALTGNMGTYWLQQNTYSNDPYEIVLCSIETPLDIPSDDFFESKEEKQKYEKSDLSLEEFLGDKYNDRLNVIFDEWSYDFGFDYEYIEEQLEKLAE